MSHASERSREQRGHSIRGGESITLVLANASSSADKVAGQQSKELASLAHSMGHMSRHEMQSVWHKRQSETE